LTKTKEKIMQNLIWIYILCIVATYGGGTYDYPQTDFATGGNGTVVFSTPCVNGSSTITLYDIFIYGNNGPATVIIQIQDQTKKILFFQIVLFQKLHFQLMVEENVKQLQ